MENLRTARNERERGRGLNVSYERVGRKRRYGGADEACKKGVRDRLFRNSLAIKLKICGMVSVITGMEMR